MQFTKEQIDEISDIANIDLGCAMAIAHVIEAILASPIDRDFAKIERYQKLKAKIAELGCCGGFQLQFYVFKTFIERKYWDEYIAAWKASWRWEDNRKEVEDWMASQSKTIYPSDPHGIWVGASDCQPSVIAICQMTPGCYQDGKCKVDRRYYLDRIEIEPYWDKDAKKAYESYANDCGWTTAYGAQIPKWEEASLLEKRHWRAVVMQMLGLKR